MISYNSMRNYLKEKSWKQQEVVVLLKSGHVIKGLYKGKMDEESFGLESNGEISIIALKAVEVMGPMAEEALKDRRE